MKKIIALISICLAIVTAAFPAFAQQQPATPQDPQCTPEAKTAVYNEFRQNFKTDTAKANELAKKWLACPQVAGEEQITPYLKDFITKYAKANTKNQLYELVYVKKDYAKAFEIGKPLLAEDPENLRVILDLGYAGLAAALENKTNFVADATAYAKKAMEMLEGGKAPERWEPYAGKEDALAFLNSYLGRVTAQNEPAAALPYLIKVAQLESKLKKLPSTYGIIGEAYEAGPYAKLAADYKTMFGGKDETPESKLALENINQVVDRMIDAYARAVALAGTDPANKESKTRWMESLSSWYKYRHNQSDTGLTEMIAGILSKPLPPLPTPITTLPAAAPASTPTSGTVSAAGAPAGNGAASAAATGTTQSPTSSNATPATTTPKTAPATTDKPKTNPAKPRPKRNYRGR